jgi:hypothetical protein
LQAFAEMHHWLKSAVQGRSIAAGQVMSGEERFRAMFNNMVLVTAMHLGTHIVTAPETRLPARVLETVRRTYRTRFAALEARRKGLDKQLDAVRKGTSDADVGELLKELESLYNTEFTLISRATRLGNFTPAEVQAALDSYARPVRGLEIEFARMGMDFGPPEAAMFRPIGAQIVEFRPEGMRFLKEHYAAARGEFVLVSDGVYRGTIHGETVYWIPRGGRPALGGAMRGPGVLPLASTDVLHPTDVADILGELVRVSRTGILRHGANFGTVPLPDSRTLHVPLHSGGSATVILDIQIRRPTGVGAHGAASGHARNQLVLESGEWRAQIDIDPRLRRDDAQLGLQHEVNEVAGIVRRLHGTTLTGPALQRAILSQQVASLMREGARGVEASEHDIATTIDLVRLYQRYQAEPSPENRASLDAQIRQMGFGARYFAQEYVPAPPTGRGPLRARTPNVMIRDELVRQVVDRDVRQPGLADQILTYIEDWRHASIPQTPFVHADRPHIVARLREYSFALTGRTIGNRHYVQESAAGTLDAIEQLAQAAIGRDRITVADLVEAGMPVRAAQRAAADLGGVNHYRTLYAELESLIALRHRLAAAAQRGDPPESVGFGFPRRLASVRLMTGAGLLDGQPFAEVMRRIRRAYERGHLVVRKGATDPLQPDFAIPADPNSAVRLTWRFSATPGGQIESLFSIDLPGVTSTPRPFQLSDMMHADFEPAQPSTGHGAQHVTETGVVVPPGSAPAHVYIRPDRVFETTVDGWGLKAWRRRFQE